MFTSLPLLDYFASAAGGMQPWIQRGILDNLISAAEPVACRCALNYDDLYLILACNNQLQLFLCRHKVLFNFACMCDCCSLRKIQLRISRSCKTAKCGIVLIKAVIAKLLFANTRFSPDRACQSGLSPLWCTTGCTNTLRRLWQYQCGLSSNSSDLFLADGVHLNTEGGMRQYFRNICTVIYSWLYSGVSGVTDERRNTSGI